MQSPRAVDHVLDDVFPVELQVGLDIRHVVYHFLDDAFPVELQVSVDVRRCAPAAPGDPPELLDAVANVDVEPGVVKREEVRVADADLEYLPPIFSAVTMSHYIYCQP